MMYTRSAIRYLSALYIIIQLGLTFDLMRRQRQKVAHNVLDYGKFLRCEDMLAFHGCSELACVWNVVKRANGPNMLTDIAML
jgi:hypothetical protein